MLVVPTILSSGKVYRFQLSRHHYTPRLIRPPISLVVPEINIFFRRSLVIFFSSLRPILASLLSFDSSTDSKRERGSIVESNFSLQLGKIDLFNAKVCRPLSRGVGVTTTESQMIYKRAKVEQVPLKLVQKLLEIVPYLDAFQKWIPSPSYFRNVLEAIKPIDIQTLGRNTFAIARADKMGRGGFSFRATFTFPLANVKISKPEYNCRL